MGLAAQTRPRLTFAAHGGMVRLQQRIGDVDSTFRGAAIAGTGRITAGQFVAGAEYMEGRLNPDSAGPARRNLAEARVFAGAMPWPWLRLTAGPLLRVYVTDSTTERWTLWEARARAQGSLLGPRLATYVELWRALSASVTRLTEPVDRVQGGEAGIIYRPARGTWWMRLAYRVDDARLGHDARGETVELISLALGVDGR